MRVGLLGAGCAEMARVMRDAGDKPSTILGFGYNVAAPNGVRQWRVGSFELNAEQMHSAFGIALMQTSGAMQVVHGGDPPGGGNL
jgi:hypothetical protein